jgi:uncharacterized protein YkwD
VLGEPGFSRAWHFSDAGQPGFMKRSVGTLILLGVGFISAVASRGETEIRRVAGATPAVEANVTPAGLTAALLAETNRVRLEHGCRPLRPLPELNAAAADQAAFMALTLHAMHGNPLRGEATALERVRRHGLAAVIVAENVASQPVDPAAGPFVCAAIAVGLVESWMNSPGHRANLLNHNFTHIGCAARIAPGFGPTEYVFGAQVFSTVPPFNGRM